MGTNCKEYDFLEIERHWQSFWDKNRTFRADDASPRPKCYVLDMFPYPSGAGLHIGHPEGYTATDIVARYRRARQFKVLHPIGWDAFGLPAEQHAIKTGTPPASNTRNNIANFRRQIKALGFSYDWDREIDTTDPRYFRWTQWIFLQLFKRGLAYVDERPVWWCPELRAVLANEEVVDGRSEIGGHPVERKNLRQWVLRITAYADRLLADLKGVDWPDSTKRMQEAWIGRSEGADVLFQLEEPSLGPLKIFTTRPDTLFGCTYMVLAPEHPLVGCDHPPGQARGGRGLPKAGGREERPRADRPGEGQVRRLHRRIRDQSRPTANACPSGSPTTSSWATGPARSWPCPPTTSATSSSPADTNCPSSRSIEPAGAPAPLPYIGPGLAREFRRLHRPGIARGDPEDHRGPGLARRRQVLGQLQAARLALLQAAVLGGADPDRVGRRGGLPPGGGRARERPAPRTRHLCREGAHALRPAPSRFRPAPLSAGGRLLRAERDRRKPAGQRIRMARHLVQPAFGPGRLRRGAGPIRRGLGEGPAGDEHHAAMGRLVLVLPALHRSPGQRGFCLARGPAHLGSSRSLRRRGRARRPAPPLRPFLAQGSL